ncbi:males-absent on the first protein [Staphylotrichum tortipilum]|uniref:histone acetyltransferase n=1 Tax=Staphylotrichum tortipilum TaxID=2831512 RepID=A0AAN6RVU9_9PEZI|nr:males-absent on the first protein [Staphylotrichum longicolle]
MPVHLKRKRPTGASETPAAPTPDLPRRATRQSSIPPLPVPQDPEPRRRRRRPDANGQPPESSQPSRSPRGKENHMPVHSLLPATQPMKHAPPPPSVTATATATATVPAPTRRTRHSATSHNTPAPPAPPTATPMSAAEHPVPINTILQPTPAVAFAPNQHHPAAAMPALDPRRPPPQPRPAPGPARRGHRPSVLDPFIPHQQSVSVGRSKPIIMTTSVAPPGQPPNPKTTGGAPDGAAGSPQVPTGQPERNIDKVMLGDICFRTWYASYYGKEVLGDVSGGSSKGGKFAKTNGNTAAPHHHHHPHPHPHDAKDDASGAKAPGRRDRDNHPPMLDRLYVCPCCFRYSRELVTWWEHVRWCERRGVVPGNKIYTHPKGKRTVLVPSGPVPKQGRGKRSSVGQKMVEEVVQDEGEWSIWEVDGETDVLFCQNLSLFAKLFLDNKSVFFDVTGFNYFLLVYTPSPPPPPPTGPDTNMAGTVPPPPRGQIVGFFSKEKLSWDNNNLACILVFPPWQRKGLGALLMGVSYEISRREGLLGGPEKPISDLGKKGYKRFWAGEVARWILGLAPSAEEETVVDVNECSQATWIAPEDCLLVLREMGVAEDAGQGPPPPAIKANEPGADADTATNTTNTAAALTSDAPPAAADQAVQRVRISQAAVRAWVAANRISLERACDPDGFVEGYAVKARGGAASEEPARVGLLVYS